MPSLTLNKHNRFYRLPTKLSYYGEPSPIICTKWVARRLGSRPKNLKVSYRLKNPRRPGWMKVYFTSPIEINTPKNGRYYKSGTRYELMQLARKVLGSEYKYRPFWVKLEPLEE